MELKLEKFILSVATKYRKIVLRELTPEKKRKSQRRKEELIKKFDIEVG